MCLKDLRLGKGQRTLLESRWCVGQKSVSVPCEIAMRYNMEVSHW